MEELAEKFHVSPRLLAELNPGKDLEKAGQVIVRAAAVDRSPARRALRVVIFKIQTHRDSLWRGSKILAQYPATIGGEHDPLPIGRWTITIVQHDPWFNYDPLHFWNASPDEATAKLPPGPRNPVGVVWMETLQGALRNPWNARSRPRPARRILRLHPIDELDAADLSHMVIRGTPAILEE